MPAQIPWQTQYTSETRPWAVDVSADLDPLDTIGTVTATMTDLLTGADVSSTCLSGTLAVAGNVITQPVHALVAGHSYRLMLIVSVGGSKVTSQPVFISTPY